MSGNQDRPSDLLGITGWRELVLVPLHAIRRPWKASIQWVNLYEATGQWSTVSGVFDMTLRLDPLLQQEPECLQRFVIAHEVEHLRGRHGFWAALSLLGGPLSFFLARRIQEEMADQAARNRMRPQDVARAMALLHRHPKRWWPRLVHAWLYGHPRARLARVGIVVG